MSGAIKWMAHNKVTANLLMIVLLLGGLFMSMNIKQEVFPEIDFDRVTVSVAYPGAGPEEIEEGIILKIEENLSGITGIKELKSTASEGLGTVSAEVLPNEDIDLVMLDIKSEVDRITTFPEEAERPVIAKIVNRSHVIAVAINGDMPERSLREYAEQVNDDLLALPEISQTDISGVRVYEISIEITEENLRRYNLTPALIADRIRKASVDMPAGDIETSGGQILIRTKEKRYKGYGYGEIIIHERPDGTELKISDIADVRDAFQESDLIAKFDGKRAAVVNVYRVGDQRPTDISQVVRDYVEKRNALLPETVGLETMRDSSELLKSRVNLLIKNALLGLVMVFIVLGLFLRIRLAMWVMLGIPISFLGAMILMPGIGVSINMISLFAFILALGIVVDDAIVVGENIFEHQSNGSANKEAAVNGTIEVAAPVIFSVLTTIAAFLPLMYVEGTMGKFIKTVPLVVIPILFFSLVESLFILPAHLGHSKASGPLSAIKKPLPHERIRLGFGKFLSWFINGPYHRALKVCLDYRYATVAAAIAILLLTVGLVGGGIVKFRFMPKVDGDFITAKLEMPIGTPIEVTEAIQDMIVKRAEEVVAKFDAERPDGSSVLRNIYATVGATLKGGGPHAGGSSSGSNLAEVALVLTPSEERGVAAAAITASWRRAVGEVAGVDSLIFFSDMVGFGANIDVRLAHDDFNVLQSATAGLKEALMQYPGVGDIADSQARGKRELKIKLKPAARTLGVTEAALGSQIRSAFYGAEALRFQRGRNEIKVMVRYPEAGRSSITDLENMRIMTPDGAVVPFSMAATIEKGRGYSRISRTDRKRVVNITASVDGKVANAEEIVTDMKGAILADLVADYPGLTIDLEGEDKERRDSLGSMKKGFLIALGVMFVLLAIPFGSYSQPLIIMAAIPFGLVGAILGHFIMGFNLSILSMFGLVALSGVLINDALLFVDYINKRRMEGVALKDATMEAGRRRFRPIVLTSLTTSLGLMPMILETSVQAQFLIPMAISLGFGILFATGITLLLIPSLYLILEDFHRVLGLKPFYTEAVNAGEELTSAGS